MAGNSAAVKMGACWVTFGTKTLGTQGVVKVSYKAESMEKTVDQEDAPIGEVIMKQNFEVKVPMADSTIEPAGGPYARRDHRDRRDHTHEKEVVLSGSTGTDLLSLAQELSSSPWAARPMTPSPCITPCRNPNLSSATRRTRNGCTRSLSSPQGRVNAS